MELSIEATRARATVGEISSALDVVFTRHIAPIRSISGVYGGAYDDDAAFAALRRDVSDFATSEGRRPRLLVVKMGQDGHDRGAKVIATRFPPTWVSMSTSAPCSRPPRKPPVRPPRTMCM